MMKRTSIEDLPEDLRLEILSKVPVVSLAQFRFTSKRWNTLIKSERLAKRHYANVQRQSLVIILINLRVYLLSVDFRGYHNNKVTPLSLKDPSSVSSEQVHVRNVFHCDGLLLCSTMDNRLVVFNPCSGETKWIQPRRNRYKESDDYSLGKSSSNQYKILRLDQSFGVNLVEYEVYDFTSNSWSLVGVTTDWRLECFNRGVFVKGNTYWIASSQHDEYHMFLVSFDFSTERFQTHEHLTHYFRYKIPALSVVREEQLCMLTYHQHDNNTLYVRTGTKTENTGVMSWSKFLTAKNVNHKFSHYMSFVVDEQNKVMVCCDCTKVPNKIMHIVGEDRCIQVEHQGEESSFPFLLSYVPTLVQISQGS